MICNTCITFRLFYSTRTYATIKLHFFPMVFSFLDGTENVSFIVYDCGADQWRTKNYHENIFANCTVIHFIWHKNIWVGRHPIQSLRRPTVSRFQVKNKIMKTRHDGVEWAEIHIKLQNCLTSKRFYWIVVHRTSSVLFMLWLAVGCNKKFKVHSRNA